MTLRAIRLETFVREMFIDGKFRNFADDAALNIYLANCSIVNIYT